jgi:hypothetical protein
MGGSTFYSEVYRPTEQDRQMWVTCALRWRGKTLAAAMQEAGLRTA